MVGQKEIAMKKTPSNIEEREDGLYEKSSGRKIVSPIDDGDNLSRDQAKWMQFAPSCKNCRYFDKEVSGPLAQCRFDKDTPFGTFTGSICKNYKSR